MTLTPSPEFTPLSLGLDEDIAPLPVYKAAGTQSIDFDGMLSPPLLLHEDLKGGCGGQLWPAGMVLSKYMLRYHREDLEKARILELGAGGGLVGLAVALGCPSLSEKLVITDQVNMLSLMEQNISLNNLESKVTSLVLDWGAPLPDLVKANPPSHILAADCVYFEPAFPLLIQTLEELFELNGDAVCWFVYKKRRKADIKFMKMARKSFDVEETADEDRKVWEREGLFMYTFTKKRRGQPGRAKQASVEVEEVRI